MVKTGAQDKNSEQINLEGRGKVIQSTQIFTHLQHVRGADQGGAQNTHLSEREFRNHERMRGNQIYLFLL